MGMLSLRLRVKLSQNCGVCGVSNDQDPVDDIDGVSIAIFGVAPVEELFARGICPKCLRDHQPWTAAQQNRLAKWILRKVKARRAS